MPHSEHPLQSKLEDARISRGGDLPKAKWVSVASGCPNAKPGRIPSATAGGQLVGQWGMAEGPRCSMFKKCAF